MTGQSFAALISAAGRSSRMGTPKALLPLGEETVVERLVGVFHEAGIRDVVVVVGHGFHLLVPLLEKRAARWVMNDRFDDGMFSSVKVGAAFLGREKGRKAFFFHPVDIPLIRPETLRTLAGAFREGETDVCRPCFQGRRGHPPLISWALIPSILEFAGPEGLRSFLSRRDLRSLDVECADPGVLRGMNTPEEYERVRENLLV